MAVQVQQPTRRKKDIFDIIVGGLQAASAFTNIQKAQSELEKIPEIKARQQRQEEQKFATQFVPAEEGRAGAVELEAPTGERGLFVPRAQIIQEGELRKQRQAAQKEKFGLETKLRDEWLKNPQTKVTQDVSVAAGKVREVGESDPSAAGDLSLIFNYMKLLDPGSVVREGEFATAQNAAGIPDQAKNLYNRILTGQRLNPEQRKDFVSRAEQLYDVHLGRQKAFNEAFEDLARKQNLNPKNVVLDLKFLPQKKKGLTPSQRFVDDIKVLEQNLSGIDQVPFGPQLQQPQPPQLQQLPEFDIDKFLAE